VRMQRKLEEDGSAKPTLTAYLPAYRPSFDPAGRKREPYRIYPLERERGVLAKLTTTDEVLRQVMEDAVANRDVAPAALA
jgi:hypothetical protein